ncbi:MAG: hypothetical protein HQL91_07000 [Magnetococcales bacterium]|nr:hypothetical protein [Magnetococcales bacterium]
MPDIFADSIQHIDFSGGLVRLELVSAYPPRKSGDDPINLQQSGRLVMPLDGFLSTFQAMQNLIDQLLKAGIVQKRQEGAAATHNPPT